MKSKEISRQKVIKKLQPAIEKHEITAPRELMEFINQFNSKVSSLSEESRRLYSLYNPHDREFYGSRKAV